MLLPFLELRCYASDAGNGSRRLRRTLCSSGFLLNCVASLHTLGRLILHGRSWVRHAPAPEPTPDTVARKDLKRFQAVVWCSDPDLIPNASYLRIPEPPNPNIGAELYLRPDEIIYYQLRLLRYRIEIEILEIQDWKGCLMTQVALACSLIGGGVMMIGGLPWVQ
jgi:hypothetical protein